MSYSSVWSEIRNDFCDEDEKKVYIDAWLSDDGDEEGEVIAKVHVEDKTIEYLDERARKDYYAQEVIKETISGIENGDYEML